MVKDQVDRLLPLEGLRVVAASVVVLFHALVMFYPSFFYGFNNAYSSIQNSRFEDNFYGNPFSVFLSGTFAVSLFFVLSGFVLTVKFFQSGQDIIIRKMAAKRYLRLMLPALFSILFAWLLLTSPLSDARIEVAKIAHSGWLANLWSFPPDLFTALGQGLWGVFSIRDASYNPVLWTIYYEFIGSFIIFVTVLLFGKSQRRWIVYIFLCLGLFHTWMLGFIFGMIIADLYANRRFPFTVKQKDIRLFYPVMIVGLFLGGYPAVMAAGVYYQTIRLPFLNPEQNQSLFTALGALLVVSSILIIPLLHRIFSYKWLSGLGKYTYSLYLVHMPILFSLCATVFLYIHGLVGYHIAAFISIIATLPVIVLVTYLFEYIADAPSIRLSTKFSRWLLEK